MKLTKRLRVLARRAAWHCGMLTLALTYLPTMALASGNPDATQEVRGSLVIVGGALRFDHAQVWQTIVERAGGSGAKIMIIPAASADPDRSAARVQEILNQHGAQAEILPLSPKYIDIDGQPSYRRLVKDTELVSKMTQATGLFLTGGDQNKITRVLRLEDGRASPLLNAIWDMYRRGGVIAGTSAGAAVMSEVMFSNVKTVLSTMQRQLRMGHELATGLAWIGSDILIDQHFIIRGRIGRLLAAMQSQGIPLGLGVDENTAMLVREQRYVEVLGYKGVVMVSLNQPQRDLKSARLNLKGVRLSYLSHGDQLDLLSQHVTPAQDKKPLHVAQNEEVDQQVPVHTDLLANTVLVEAMSQLMESDRRSIKGLAFDATQKRPSWGFEFRLYKVPESRAFFSSASGMEAFTLLNIALDVTPIRVRTPLY